MRVRVLLEPPPYEPVTRSRGRGLRWLQWILLVIGIGALGYAGFGYLDSGIYQAYENWAFNQQVAGKAPGLWAFIRDGGAWQSLVAGYAGNPAAIHEEPVKSIPPAQPPRLATGSVVGRIDIPRLGLRAIVKEGVDDGTLRRAVGHVPGTAQPGDEGNVGLAGHRDTFFRSLQGVRKNDRIVLETLGGRYEYVVDSTRIVTPKDVEVLDPTPKPALTLVTCYPFYYVGNAPRRFIVRARQVLAEARDHSGRSGSGS